MSSFCFALSAHRQLGQHYRCRIWRRPCKEWSGHKLARAPRFSRRIPEPQVVIRVRCFRAGRVACCLCWSEQDQRAVAFFQCQRTTDIRPGVPRHCARFFAPLRLDRSQWRAFHVQLAIVNIIAVRPGHTSPSCSCQLSIASVPALHRRDIF